MMKKLKVGVFSFTSDEGCSMQILEVLNYAFKKWEKKIDFSHFRLISPRKEMENLDIAFVEGAISTKSDLTSIRKIRNSSKKVVAIGSCAINGSPSNYRNFFNEKSKNKIKSFLKRFEHLEKVEPINKYVKVDAVIPGCPISEKDFFNFVENSLKKSGVKNA